MLNCNIKEAKNFIKKVVDAGEHLPIFIWGGPGLGKSSIVRQVCEEKGIGFVDIRLSYRDPVDLRGIPRIQVSPDGTSKTV
ncbi:MAG: hypothetical protein QXI58_04175, partial [Candidatus Micrarchaeia archaeon]